MKLLDLVCSTCAHKDEYLLSSEEVAHLPLGQLKLPCAACSKATLTLPEEVQLKAKHGRNFSWSRWNV